ncbi:hypothetical protein DID78_01015 [Candidatus Marinamargulisbacteria bacterium SCGC AG-343-D04]|nr:hypothetical protein DID78_01015 [Candidatus Marinamargulisbacteria bacterium SCGC AG-343-D04]
MENFFTKPTKKKKLTSFFAIIGLSVLFTLILHVFLVSVLVAKFDVVSVFFSLISEERVSGKNILVFGIDDTRAVQRSDSILVVNLDDQNKRIGILSIPRDTRVKIDGAGFTRINHAYAYGGVDLLQETVSTFLELPLHHYVKIDLSGVEKFVDIIGGVKLNVQDDLHYTDQAGDLYINIEKGEQVLTGQKAVQYLRFRQDNEGDIGRIKRQQRFITQLSKKIFSFESITKLPKIVRHVSNTVHSDLSFSQMVGIAMQFKDAVRYNHVKKATVPGAIMLSGGAYYWKPDISSLDTIVDDVLLGFNKQIPVVASLLDTQPVNHKPLPQTSSKKKVKPMVRTEILSPPPSLPESKIVSIETLDFDDPKETITSQPLQPSSKLALKPVHHVDVKPVELSKVNNAKSSSQTKDKVLNRRKLTMKEVSRVAELVDVNEQYEFAQLNVEVLNGTGKAGKAKRTARVLKKFGLNIPRFDNAGHFNYPNTVLVDWKGNIEQSLKLAQLLNIQPENIIVYDKDQKPLDFTLVIGQDWKDIKHLLEQLDKYEHIKKHS